MREFFISTIQSVQETPSVHILEYMLGLLPETSKTLTAAEHRVLTTLKKETFVLPPKGKQRVLAMVGLTGDGKTYIAERLAREHDATLISSDTVRVALKNEGCSYENVNTIVRRFMLCVLSQNGSVVLDSDHVTPNKRGSLNRSLREFGIIAEYVRVIADSQDALRWIREGRYEGTIYDPKTVSRGLQPGGWRLKTLERERHSAWHCLRDGTPRKFLFTHMEVRNRETQ